MDYCTVRILSNKAIAKDYYALELQLPANHKVPQPGQFLTLRIGNTISPLLRRPFAYSAYNTNTGLASIIYERRGLATQALTALSSGDELDYLGPLGNAFPMPEKNSKPILCGGGIGMGPILYLYNYLLKSGFDPIIAIGSRNQDRLPTLPVPTIISTDDGSQGFKGTILQALQNDVYNIDTNDFHFYACGPTVMMDSLWQWAQDRYPKALVHVSLEQTMACAIGACMGCVVKTHYPRPYARVCTEGPVFDAKEIAWRES